MFAATAPEVNVEDDKDSDEWVEPLAILDEMGAQTDAEGQPSASSMATGTASSEFNPQFYDAVLMDYIHEIMAGDSKKLTKVVADMWKSIHNEDNALSLN